MSRLTKDRCLKVLYIMVSVEVLGIFSVVDFSVGKSIPRQRARDFEVRLL